MQNSTFEQYKLLWDAFNGEMQRFWTRFNILIGIEIVACYGILKLKQDINADNDNGVIILGALLIVMIFFSISTCLIVHRAIGVYKIFYESLCYFESLKKGSLFLITLAEEMAEKIQIEKVENPKSMLMARTISILLSVVWIFATLFYLSVLVR